MLEVDGATAEVVTIFVEVVDCCADVVGIVIEAVLLDKAWAVVEELAAEVA